MALQRKDLQRLAQLQRQMAALAYLETEVAIQRLLQDYDALAASILPLRREAVGLLKKGELDQAERMIHEIERRVTAWLMARARVEREIIEGIIEQSAIRGAQAVDIIPMLLRNRGASFEQLLGLLESAGGAAPSILGPVTGTAVYGEISRRVKDAITRRVYMDGLNLSQRLHVRLAERAVEFQRILTEGLQQGRAAVALAKEIAKLDITDPQLPEYLRRLRDAVKGTRQADVIEEVLRAVPEMLKRKPGPLGLRGPAKRVLQAAQSGSAEKLDAAIDYFLARKARYHAIVIARTEAQIAFRAGHVEKAKESPYVVGIKWNLSGSHSRPCECEVYATQNRYGLGPGVFPPDQLPERPHPNCMCYFTDVVDLDKVALVA